MTRFLRDNLRRWIARWMPRWYRNARAEWLLDHRH